MGGTRSPKPDKRPKRRKDKDDPYEMFSIGTDTAAPRYYVRFWDGTMERCLEIDKPLFDEIDRFESEDLPHLVDNHYERSELTEASLNARAFEQPQSIDKIFSEYAGSGTGDIREDKSNLFFLFRCTLDTAGDPRRPEPCRGCNTARYFMELHGYPSFLF